MDDDPIIIKRINKGGHGAHGGAWKVAYADFVTAMMAFFLLLWLLSSASKEQKDGLAEYFTPTVGLSGGAGVGIEGGTSSMEKEGKKHQEGVAAGVVVGDAPAGMLSQAPSKSSSIEYDRESMQMDDVEAEINNSFDEGELVEFRDNILIDRSPDGLRIQIVDGGRSMFKPGSAELYDHAKKILDAIHDTIKDLHQRLAISGHTDSTPYGKRGLTNWDLSANRANASRSYLESIGTPSERFAKVIGMADQDPLVPEEPESVINRRITITLLKRSVMPYYQAPATDALLSIPDGEDEEHLELKTDIEGKKIPAR